MEQLRQDILDSFPYLKENDIFKAEKPHNISLESKVHKEEQKEQTASFDLTDVESQKEVSEKGQSWVVTPMVLNKLNELEHNWSKPATKSHTNCLSSFLPCLEYQHSFLLSAHYVSLPPPMISILPLSYQYVTERRNRRQKEKDRKEIKTSSAIIHQLLRLEDQYRPILITEEELKSHSIQTNSSEYVRTDMINNNSNYNNDSINNSNAIILESLQKSGVANDHDKRMIIYDKATDVKDDSGFINALHLNMSFPHFKPERDVSNFKTIQRSPKAVCSIHKKCELDNNRHRFD